MYKVFLVTAAVFKSSTYDCPSGVNAFRRNSYDAKYIPVAGTSVEKAV